MNTKLKDKIRVALAGQTSGLLVADIRERGGVNDKAGCMASLMQMKAAGEVLSHKGETAHATRYSLNPAFAGAADARSSAGGGAAQAF